jgi:hypothetical protein
VVKDRIDALEDFRKQLEGADVDLLRQMVKVFAEQLMGADADALCGADYGERSPERTNRRNGYRERPWAGPRTTVVGTASIGTSPPWKSTIRSGNTARVEMRPPSVTFSRSFAPASVTMLASPRRRMP